MVKRYTAAAVVAAIIQPFGVFSSNVNATLA